MECLSVTSKLLFFHWLIKYLAWQFSMCLIFGSIVLQLSMNFGIQVNLDV